MSKKKLTLAKVDEISLVDRGDNPEAHVRIHKRAEGPASTPAPAAPAAAPSPAPSGVAAALAKRVSAVVAKLLGRPEEEVQKAWDEATTFGELEQQRRMRAAISETWDFAYLWQESIASILRDPDVEDRATKILASTSEFSAAVTAAVSRWVKGETTDGAVEKMVGKAGRPISGERLSRLKDMNDQLSAMIAELDPTPATEDAVADTVDKTKSAPAPAPAAVGELTEEVLKSLPEGVRKAIEAMQATTTTALAKAAAAETLAAAERDLRETAEIAKRFDTGGDLHGLPNSEDLVPQLLTLKRSAPDGYAVLEKTLLSSAEVIRAGTVFKEIGSGGDATLTGGSAMAKIEAAADELMKSDPRLTRPAAIAKVHDTRPELVAEYNKQRRS